MGEPEALKPSIEKPRQRIRIGFVIALAAVMAVGVAVPLVLRLRQIEAEVDVEPSHAARDVSPRCTPLEARLYLAHEKLPLDETAACLAMAGAIDDARSVLRAMPAETRGGAIARIFELAHPTADAGDDRSAGPLMMLVVEFWPENYMAVFHAGMAEFALGADPVAQTYLDRFLTMYAPHDVWRDRALTALAAIAAHAPLDHRQAHFAE